MIIDMSIKKNDWVTMIVNRMYFFNTKCYYRLNSMSFDDSGNLKTLDVTLHNGATLVLYDYFDFIDEIRKASKEEIILYLLEI